MKRFLIGLLAVSVLAWCMCCASLNRTQKGAVIGTAGGAVAGGLIGKAAGNTLLGAILGAAIGGAGGAYVGHYMDKQADEMRSDLQGARVDRVGEGIRITFDSGLLFDVDSYELREQSRQNLGRLASVLNKYPDTNVLIEGHTDSTGSREHNIQLSERRANSVAHHLATLNVAANRFSVMGYGPDQPLAANDTAEGRQQNRRVDLAIMANDKLKKAAQSQG